MSRQTPRPDGPPPPPTVQRLRVRYAKRDRLRFASHRDIARMLERAIRRAEVPISMSAGFSPHPRISYVGACPTGVASEAEYLELGLHEVCDPDKVRVALDAALPSGIDVLEVREAAGGSTESLAALLLASTWRMVLHGVDAVACELAVAELLRRDSVIVQRTMKDGIRDLDARAAVVRLAVVVAGQGCATLEGVVRHMTPTVRPDDVLAALRAVADLAPAEPCGSGQGQQPMVRLEATRLAQGRISEDGRMLDPLAP